MCFCFIFVLFTKFEMLNFCLLQHKLRNNMKIKYTLLLLFLVILTSFGQQQAQIDKRLLVGEWSRTESPCQIKITEAYDNGKLELAYFNLKSINTGKTYWLIKGTFLSLYLELLDENNPVPTINSITMWNATCL